MTTTTRHSESESLVARILEELEANPDARALLLRALLAEDFLLLPAKVDQIQIATDKWMAECDEWRAQFDCRLSRLEAAVSRLARESEERKIANRFHLIVCLPLRLRRADVVLSYGKTAPLELLDPIEDAMDEDRITVKQFRRIVDTDLIFTARRRRNGYTEQTRSWCAVEISTTVRDDDVIRARESADAIASAVGADALAIVAGPAIVDTAQALLGKENVVFTPSPVWDDFTPVWES